MKPRDDLPGAQRTTPFDWEFPYPSQRMPTLARNIVATSQPLAAQAGLRMMLKGGNAVDAILATAISLTVLEPTSNGIGSDAFCILWDGTRFHGLNASGRAPAAWAPTRFRDMRQMPQRGWESVTVPGAVSAWLELSTRFGKLPFADLFEPAIRYAEHGYLVSPTIARLWENQLPELKSQPGFAEAFMPRGRAPEPGEQFTFPAQARTLKLIAETKGEAFYRGELAEKIAAHARQCGAALTLEDLASYDVIWDEPLVAPIGNGYTVHTNPPPNLGGTALIEAQLLAEAFLRMEGFTDIQYVDAGLGLPSGEVLARGDLDFDITFAGTVVHHLDLERPVTAVGGLHVGCYELFAREPIRTIGDLKGRRVGIQTVHGSDYFYISIMAKYVGLDPKEDIEWVTSPKGGRALELFFAGESDAFLGFPPEPQEIRARGFSGVIVNTITDKPWSDYFCCMIYGNRPWVRDHPVATKRFLRAIYKAADFCTAEPASAAIVRRKSSKRGTTTVSTIPVEPSLAT